MKIPTKVWSQLGDVAIEMKKDLKTEAGESAMGLFGQYRREIELETEQCDASKLATLFHEITHLALWDAGANNSFTEQQCEIVCDAVGSYLAGAAIAGYLTIKVPK